MLDVPGNPDIVVTLTPATLTQLVGVAVQTKKAANGGFFLDENGALVLSGDGWVVRIAGSEALLAAAGMSPERLVDALNDDPALLVSLADKAGLVQLPDLDDAFQSGFMAAVTTPTGQADSIGSNSAGAIDDGLYKLADSNDGTLLTHLDPLAPASAYFTVSVQLTTFANLFGRVNAGVGPDIAHLPPLPDEEYLDGRDPTVFTVIDPVDGAVQRPTSVTDLFSGNEDTIVSGNLAENDTLPNAGAVFAVGDLMPENGTLVLDPDGMFTFTPDPNFSGTVMFEYTVTDPASGTVTTELVEIVIVPVADAPAVTALSTTTEEDTPVALSGLSAELVDQDGSETIAVTIDGVPPGASLSAGTEISPGVWSVDPADLASLVFTPPADWHGTIDLEITATATETANGDMAVTTVPFSIEVDAQADTPSVIGGSSATDEDAAVTFGDQITYAPTDTDGSEAVSEVQITGVPAGANVTFTATGGATVTPVAGGFSITGPEADIRATLDTFAITPPANSGDDFDLSVAVTVTDADGSTATQNATHTVDVTPVADAPVPIVANAAGNEDTPIPLNGLDGTLVDTDGSETLTYRIEGLPAGAVLSAGTVQPDGSVLLTPAELTGLTITPPLHFSGTIPLTLVAISTETSNGDAAEASAPFDVVVAAVADAPTVSSASSTINEDVPGVFGTDIVYGLVDTDGSEVVSQVDVTGVPAGAAITYTAAGAAVVTAIAGGFSITGSEADIRATLDSFAYTSAPDDDSNVTLSVAVTVSDDGVDTATTTRPHELLVAAVADAPSGSGSGSGNEDTAIAVPVTTVLSDTDGSETITQAVVTAPAGVVLGGFGGSGATVVQSGQDWTITGTPAQIDAALAAMTATPPADSDADFNLSVTLTSSETSPVGGEVDTLSADTTFTVPVTVNAVADTPSVTVGPGSFNTEEDTAVALSGLGGGLSDTDGSETLSYRIEGLPAGAVLSAGTVQPDGSVLLTPAELATVTFTPPLNFHGTVPLTLVSIATEGANADTAENSVPFSIEVDAQADTPSVIGGSSATDEDAAVTFGDQITYAPTDTDGSEAVSEVQITGVPAGANVTFTATGGATVTPVAGGFSITGPEADIRATLDTFAITPPANSGDDFDLSVAVTVTDADGSTATQNATHTVDVTPVADAPVPIVANAAGNEDTPIPLNGLDGTLVDTDGSETLTYRIEGLPAGAVLSAGTVQPDGSVLLTPAELTGLTITPPLHFSGTIPLTLVAISTETSNGDAAEASAPFDVVVAAVADAPTVSSASSTINEDVPGVFGTDIVYGLVDTDGSEVVSQVDVTGVPAGAAITYTAAGAAVVTAIAGGFSITGSEADIRATLDSFAYTSAPDDDSNVTLSVAVTVSDDGVDTATTTRPHELLVAAVADAPSGSGSGSGDEDTAIAVPVTTVLSDTDGSETITQAVVTAPAGVVLGGFGGSGATVVQSGQDWTITGTPAQIDAALAAMTATPPADSDADFNLSVTLTSSETSPVGGEVDTLSADTTFTVPVTVNAVADTPSVTVGPGSFNTEEDTAVALSGLGGGLSDTDGSETLSYRIEGLPAGAVLSAGTVQPDGSVLLTPAELATVTFTPPLNFHGTVPLTLVSIATEGANADTAENSVPFSIEVDAQADTPSVIGGSSATDEDAAVTFGDQITYAPTDTDGSEAVSEVQITGVPAGANVTFTATGGATVTPVAGGFSITGPEADIRATLDTFAITPPANSGDDFDLSVAVTVTDADGSTATQNATHTVDVTPVADAPDVTGGSFTTDEDTDVALTGLAGALNDLDGSETLTHRITGVDPAASFSTGTDLGGGVWSFTAAEIAAGLTYSPPPQADGTFTMVLQSVATEDEGDVAISSANVVVNVNPILDVPNLANGSSTATEDTVIPLGNDITLSIDDLDGSQSLTIVLDGIPTTATTDWNMGLPGSVTQTGPQQWTISGTAAEAGALLDSFTVLPQIHDDANFSVAVSVTTVENGGATTTVNATHNVTVAAVADAPNLSLISAPQGDEDTVIDVPIAVSLVDTDGTETLDYVEIAGVPAGATLTIVTSGAAVATDLGGGVWRVTGPDADIQATLAGGVTIQPATHSGDNIPLTVTAQSVESNPTETEVAVPTAQTVLPVVVDVVPVADGVSATGGNFAGEEDTPISLAGLDGSGIDTDGSETITFTLSGVPSGASFDSGTDLGGGVWGFTAVQVSAGLVFNPALHQHGTVNMTLTATTTEGENGSSQSSSTAPVQIVVDAEADRPSISGTAVGNEDTAINFGSAYTVALVDQDGSESITQIAVTMPGSETATFTAVGGATVTVSGQTYTITGPEGGIQATLDTFTWTPPTHSDANITVQISATTTDADGSTATRSSNGTVRVRAVADDPDGTANNVTGLEDTQIALSLAAIDGADTDGSETISVRLFNLPPGSEVLGDETGGVIYTQSGNDWIVTGPDTATLNASLAGAMYVPPEHFSGIVNASMEVISTEIATGNEVATASASVIRNFTITVDQIADAPELRVVNATEGGTGFEDTPIRLVVDVRLVDDDGSEQLSDVTITGLPAGAQIVDGAGNPLGALQGDGSVIVTSAQLAQLHVLAPANSNDDFQLTVSATTTEANQGLGGDGDTQIGSATIDVAVIGVADPAVANPIAVVSAEDSPIPLGAGVNTVLADTDGSETLFFVIEGLPPGVVPSSGTFIGSGWQVDAADMPGLTIPSPANFSGDYVADFAPALKVRAITQENDGDQTSVNVPLDITVTPVVDEPSWNPGVTVDEDNNISLAGAAPPGLVDTDGSEAVVSYRFDFNSIVTDAGIGATVTDSSDFIANYITGTFTDNGNGTITVLAANIAGVALLASAFPDSNRDFSVPLAVEFSDTAGATVVTSTVNNTFDVDLVGVADQPTVFADNYSGDDDTLIALNPTGAEFGGETTDTDVANGQSQSESLYYIVSGLGQTGEPLLSFVNAAGDPVGFNNQDGTWLFTPADLAGLHVIGLAGQDGTANLTLTTVTNENDGDSDTNSTAFTVDITAVNGPGTPTQPLPPLVVVNPMIVDEDGTRMLDISVTPDPADPSPGTVSISVILTGIPADATVTGAFFNPVNNTWVTDAATISSGGVSISPAADYSGPLDFTVTAAAINSQQQQATTSNVPASIDVTPVADGPTISFSTAGGDEDSAIAVNISVALQDSNGTVNEQVQEPVRITVLGGATLSAGTDIGGGVWELTLAELLGLTVTPTTNSGDDISITIEATTVEPANGDTATTTENVIIPVTEVADAAVLSVSNATGDEDTAIALPGLSAALFDTDGSEVLSVTLANVPEGSILSAGANNGDGTWTIKPADLASLTITPPANWSGTVNLELVVFTLEPNGDSSQTSAPFTLTINPVADGLVLTAVPRQGDAGTPIALDLQIAPGDDTGTTPGENPPETLVVVLSGPANFVATSSGGVLEQTAAGEWTFTGSTADANSLAVTPYGATDAFDLGVSVTTVDGGSTGTPVVATVPITVTNPGLDIAGDGTGETLVGGAGADLIAGGGGADVLTGGAGPDLFVWQAGDLAGGVVDQITDFDALQDVLDLAALLTAYDPASDVVADFVALSEAGGNTTVSIDQAGGGNHTTDVVELTGVTGLDLATLVASSHITV